MDLQTRIKPYLKYFIFALISGVIIYLPMMANDLVNHLDGVWHPSYFIAGNWEISLGRGLQRYADRARFGLVSSSFDSVIVLLSIAVADALIIDSFKIKDTFFSYLFVFATVANPVVCESLSYSYMSTNFGFGYMFAVIAFSILTIKNIKRVWKLLGAVVAFAVSMTFYQSYIGVFAVLCIYYILVMLQEREEIKTIVHQLVDSLVTFVFGGALYFIITELLLLRAGTKLASYKGADDVSIVSIILSVPFSFISTYKEFWKYLFKQNLNSNLEFAHLVIILALIVIAGICIFELINLFKYKKSYFIFALVLLLILPAAACVVCMIAVGSEITGLMAMGVLMTVLGFLMLAKKHSFTRIIYGVVAVVIAWYLVSTVEADQIALKEGKIATTSITESMLDMAYENHMLENSQKVAFVGRAAENPLFYQSEIYKNANPYAKFGSWSTDPRNNLATWNGVLKIFCGVNIPLCDIKTYETIISSDYIKEMPVFPNEGCMEIKDDILVIKVSDLYY